MAYCIRCGNKVEDGSRFCPKCGAEIPDQTEEKTENCQQSGTQDYTYEQDYDRQPDNGQVVYKDNTYEQPQEEYFPQEEVQKNKGMGVLSYLGILVLIPLLAGNKQSAYVKQHINQGLSLFILSAIVDLLDGETVLGMHSFINFGNTFLSEILDIAGFALFIIAIMGIVSACKGTKKELPLVGKDKILK